MNVYGMCILYVCKGKMNVYWIYEGGRCMYIACM